MNEQLTEAGFKDGVSQNTHHLNILREGAEADVDRIPLYEVYMRMAEELAKRSTCERLQVGTVITDAALENVLAIGYNGNARGLPNSCDSAVPGNCGCIHSEVNALVKASGTVKDKVVFVTNSPCVACAKLMINSGVTHVYFRELYRDPSGIELLERTGVTPVEYNKWTSKCCDGCGGLRAKAITLGEAGLKQLLAGPFGRRRGAAPRRAGPGRNATQPGCTISADSRRKRRTLRSTTSIAS